VLPACLEARRQRLQYRDGSLGEDCPDVLRRMQIRKRRGGDVVVRTIVQALVTEFATASHPQIACRQSDYATLGGDGHTVKSGPPVRDPGTGSIAAVEKRDVLGRAVAKWIQPGR
jgi:hypothetical protein